MRVSARTQANRQNAARSTGPKSVAGKQASARNALRHGLAVPIKYDVAVAPEVERLARVIAGEGSDDTKLEAARRIAEAQFDLMRVRQFRLRLVEKGKPRTVSYSPDELTMTIKELERKYRLDDRRYFERLEASRTDEAERVALQKDGKAAWDGTVKGLAGILLQKAAAPPPKFDERMSELVPELARIDRYERRALSRRKRAIREYDEIVMSRTFVGEG